MTKGPATVVEIQDRIAKVVGEIDAKKTEQGHLQERILQLFAENPGSELTAMRERKAQAALEQEITLLEQSRVALLSVLSDARQRESDDAFRRKYEVAKAKGASVIAKGIELQTQVVLMARTLAEFKELGREFSDALPKHPSDFDIASGPHLASKLIDVALFAQSDGATGWPRNCLESPYELRESRRADFERIAENYVTIGLRGSSIPPLHHPQPPKAA